MNPVGTYPTQHMQLPLTERLLGQASTNKTEPDSFAGLMVSGVTQVNSMQHDAQGQVHEMLTGGDVSQVEVMTAVQKADMAFRMLVQVRNKLMAAYEELNAIRI